MRQSNYLFFTDQCEAALGFYTACGLGQVTDLMRYGVHAAAPVPALEGKILHARFDGPGVHFYASDNHDAEPMRGFSQHLLLDDTDSTAALFARLADGGQVTTALAVQPWGDYYGKLTDRFGVQWMLDCPNVAA